MPWGIAAAIAFAYVTKGFTLNPTIGLLLDLAVFFFAWMIASILSGERR